jgi:hypothetical protein
MKKPTAVEWFVQQIKNGIDADDGSIEMNWLHNGTIQQALEMEKENSLDSFFAGYNYEGGHPIDEHDEYYNKTYVEK